MTPDQLIQYYVSLLILQYVLKPKARSTIAALVTDVVADLIYTQVQNAFDVLTAIGAQLDTLGEYIGATRFFYGINTVKRYWAKLDYSNLTDPLYGWSTYLNLDVGGSQLSYPDLTTPVGTLNDDDYRDLLQYQAVNRSMECTAYNIDNLLYKYFGNSFFVTDNLNMSITYTFMYHTDPVEEKPVLLRAIIAMGLLPRPAGVSMTQVDVMI